jgi:hypothetical protein
MSLRGDIYAGVELPYYKEYGIEYPIENNVMAGQNYGEHQLFSLRTRLESDPLYAELATNEGTKITFRKYPSDIGMRVHLQIVSIDVKTGDRYYLSPEWLEERVMYWLNKYEDYFVLFSDQYPVELETGIPSWWIRDIMSKINLTSILQDAFVDELGPDGIQENLDAYDYFHEDGRLYIKLIDPSLEYNKSLLSIDTETPLPSGEKAFKRHDVNFGDYAAFSDRYYRLYIRLLEYLELWYSRGALPLERENPLIREWKLAELRDHPGIFIAPWKDMRFTLYDGTTPMLTRQLESNTNSWDHRLVFFHIGNNPVVHHDIVKVVPQISMIYGEMLLVRIGSLDEAISYADAISEITTSTYGTVRRSLTHSEGSVSYFDLIRGKSIYIRRVEDEEFTLPKSELIQLEFTTLSMPDKLSVKRGMNISEINKFLNIDKSFVLPYNVGQMGSPVAA